MLELDFSKRFRLLVCLRLTASLTADGFTKILLNYRDRLVPYLDH